MISNEPQGNRSNSRAGGSSHLRLAGESETSPPEPTWPAVDRRTGGDRRQQPTRLRDSLLGFRKRKRGRRDGESQNAYVDVFTRSDIALMLTVFVLNILDAFFTLRWLRMGGSEGNPLMDALIRGDEIGFLIEKCLVVGVWLIVLLIHKNFRIARWGLWGGLVLYAGVVFYHFMLLSAGPPPMISPEIALDSV